MFTVNQQVWLVDRGDTVKGKVVEVSTWGKVLGAVDDTPCFRVSSQEWKDNHTRWLSEGELQAV